MLKTDKSAKITEQNACLMVAGALTFATVMQLRQQALPLFAQRPAITVDLQGITHCDSAGVALLLFWVSNCQQQHKPITFQHVPQMLRNIAQLCEVDWLFKP